MESISARLLAQATVPLSGLALGYNVYRWPGEPGPCLVVMPEDHQVTVYDLRDLLRGAEPMVRIAMKAPDGRLVAPSPDAQFVVVCDQRELRAVNADGTVRWRLEHPCWGCAGAIDHRSEPACRGIDGGSAYVSADGAVVWAHVVSEWDEDDESGEQLLVLDAATGAVLGSAGLGGGTAGSGLLLHPDGRQAVLSVGFGQDGSACLLGRWDGTSLTLTEFEDTDRIAVDLDPDGGLLLTTPHSDRYLALYQVPETNWSVRLAAADVADHVAANVVADVAADQDVSVGWDYAGAFVDADTFIAVLDTHSPEHLRAHWLLDRASGPLGPVAYPGSSAGEMVGLVGLGEGSWATVDDQGSVRLWRRL